SLLLSSSSLYFFNAPPSSYIYTLSLHDALPIYQGIVLFVALTADRRRSPCQDVPQQAPSYFDHEQAKRWKTPQATWRPNPRLASDRKSTRLNSSHVKISYAVFCLKKKKKKTKKK